MRLRVVRIFLRERSFGERVVELGGSEQRGGIFGGVCEQRGICERGGCLFVERVS